MTALLKCLQVQGDVAGQLESIDRMLRDRQEVETRVTLNKEREGVLQYFLSVNPWENFRTSVKLRHSTTGLWLTESDTLNNWLRLSGSCLWLSGIPGAGKTILSGLVVQECLTRSTPSQAVAYFYCDYKNTKSQKITNILGAVASQLAKQSEEAFIHLQKYHESLHSSIHLDKRPEADGLISVISDMASEFDNVRIVIDGLDECVERTEEALGALKDIMSGNCRNISLAVFSRDEPKIRNVFETLQSAHIDIAAQGRDVKLYVRTEIEDRINNKRLRIGRTSLKDEIIDKLVKKAQGMFRWVSCQLDELCRMGNDNQRRAALDHLPRTLDETYERILLRLQEVDVIPTRRTLQWIAYAPEKLTAQELLEVLSISDDTGPNPDERLDEEYILSICGSLVRKVDNVLQLAHFTVQEYLEKLHTDNAHLQQFRLNSMDASELLKTSMRYLCSPEFDRPPPVTEVSFKIYFHGEHSLYGKVLKCIRNFNSGSLHGQDEIACLYRRLFHPRKTYNLMNFALTCLRLYEPFNIKPYDLLLDLTSAKDFGCLHVAAFMGLAHVCQWILTQGCDVNQPSPLVDEFTTQPLDYALCALARDSDADLVLRMCQIFLEAGANIPRVEEGGTSLGLTFLETGTHGKHLTLLFLKHGMNLEDDALAVLDERQEYLSELIDSFDDWHASTEMRAILIGMNRAAQFSDPALRVLSDEEFFRRLGDHILWDKEDYVKEMMQDARFHIDMGLPNTEGGHTTIGGTLVHIAVAKHSYRTLKLLLDSGFDPVARDENGRTALFFLEPSRSSTAHVNITIIDLLLGKGLDPAYQDFSGQTPIHKILSESTWHELVEDMDPAYPSLIRDVKEALVETIVLLATPYSVSLVDQYGKTPWFYFCTKFVLNSLQEYTKWGNLDLNLIGVHLQDTGAMSAFEATEDSSAFSLLSTNVLNIIQTEDAFAPSALHGIISLLNDLLPRAAFSAHVAAHPETVRLLTYATENNHLATIKTLLYHETSVHGRFDEESMSPIETACFNGGFEEFDIFLKHSDVARLHQHGHAGMALIHTLCSDFIFPIFGHNNGKPAPPLRLEKLEEILSQGVDVNVQEDWNGRTGQTAIMVAAQAGWLEGLELLFRYHPNTQLVDFGGWNVVACAVASGKLEILRFLQERLNNPKLWTDTFSIRFAAGPIINQGELYMCSLIHVAVTWGHSHLLPFLSDTGYFSNIDEPTKEGVTPMHLAVWCNENNAANWLIENGADVNAATKTYGMTPLHLAVLREDKDVMKVLIGAGAMLQKDSEGRTPEMVATRLFAKEARTILEGRRGPDTPYAVVNEVAEEAVTQGLRSSQDVTVEFVPSLETPVDTTELRASANEEVDTSVTDIRHRTTPVLPSEITTTISNDATITANATNLHLILLADTPPAIQDTAEPFGTISPVKSS